MGSTFRSYAKINLTLEVVGRRPDGYHELRTIFQTIDLADEIELRPTRSPGVVELVVEGSDLASGESNLAWRAARRFLDGWAPAGFGVSIRLRKRIPLGSGLGGGSSNAATVLLALDRIFETEVPVRELAALGSTLGADVPFFLTGGTALGVGRGDDLRALEDPSGGPEELFLALPPWSISTADVYAAVQAPAAERTASAPVRRALGGEGVARVEEWIGPNDLESAAFAVRPEEGALYTSLVRSGARVVRMSGSGSALFALFDDPAAAGAVVDRLPSGTVWQRVSTLGRDSWRRASGLAGAV